MQADKLNTHQNCIHRGESENILFAQEVYGQLPKLCHMCSVQHQRQILGRPGKGKGKFEY